MHRLLKSKNDMTTRINDIFITLFFRSVAGIFGILTIALINKTYGPEALGRYTSVLTQSTLLSATGGLGLHLIAARYIAISNNMRETAKALMLLSLVSSVLISLLFVFFHKVTALKIVNDLYVCLIFGFILSMHKLGPEILRGCGLIKPAAVFSGSFVSILFLTLIFLFDNLITSEWLAIYHALIYTIAIFCILYIIMNKTHFHPNKFQAFNINNEKSKIASAYFTSLIGFLLGNLDVLIVSYAFDYKILGIYVLYTKIALAFTLPLMAVNGATKHLVARLSLTQKFSDISNLYARICLVNSILAVAIFVALVLTPDSFIINFLGAEFLKNKKVLYILGCAQLIVLSIGASGFMLQMVGNAERVLISNIVGLIAFSTALFYFYLNGLRIIDVAYCFAFSILITQCVQVYSFLRIIALRQNG